MVRVGLTGGIGSGKSAVAQLFAGWGAVLIDADILARAVVAPGTPGLAEIAARWPAALTPNGALDRAALADIVFADPAARATLNSIVHPRVRERASAQEVAASADAIVVHVVPLLFESDFWKSCDRTVLVRAPRATRIERVVARDGWTVAAVEARMAAQIDPQRAAELADCVIDNSSDWAALERQARAVYEQLRTLTAA